jgi:hypothetical protein
MHHQNGLCQTCAGAATVAMTLSFERVQCHVRGADLSRVAHATISVLCRVRPRRVSAGWRRPLWNVACAT